MFFCRPSFFVVPNRVSTFVAALFCFVFSRSQIEPCLCAYSDNDAALALQLSREWADDPASAPPPPTRPVNIPSPFVNVGGTAGGGGGGGGGRGGAGGIHAPGIPIHLPTGGSLLFGKYVHCVPYWCAAYVLSVGVDCPCWVMV